MRRPPTSTIEVPRVGHADAEVVLEGRAHVEADAFVARLDCGEKFGQRGGAHRELGCRRAGKLAELFTELARLVESGDDVRPTDELAAHVELRDGRPGRKFLDSLA